MPVHDCMPIVTVLLPRSEFFEVLGSRIVVVPFRNVTNFLNICPAGEIFEDLVLQDHCFPLEIIAVKLRCSKIFACGANVLIT